MALRDLSNRGPDTAPEMVEAHEEDKPTASHSLADQATEKPPDEKGYAEQSHGDEDAVEVENLGWNTSDPSRDVPNPLSIPDPPLAELDLNIADDEEFSPEKLRAHIERLYMTVVVGAFSLWKHVVRLRSWREYKRTSTFLAVYALAWALDLLIPTVAAFLMVLILCPAIRPVAFPTAPPSLIDPHTGGVKKPASGVLGSDESVTGAPERYPGEAVEREAHSFVTSISSLVVSTAAGSHPQGEPSQPQNKGDDNDEPIAPDPADAAEDVIDAKDKAGGREPDGKFDKTRKPVSSKVWEQARPVMHFIADFVDTYERFGNALSPTAPFPLWMPRCLLAGVLTPLLLGSLFVSSYMINKGIGFAVGFVFFGDPAIQRGIFYTNRAIPNWQKYVELRNTLLRGIPTNAQLTITLLRIGERNKAPLPPPPSPSEPPSMEPHGTACDNLEHLGVDMTDINEAVQADHETLHQPLESETSEKKQKKGHKIVNFLKGSAKSGINTMLTANKIKAQAGCCHAKNRLGVVKKSMTADPPAGPVRFPCRYKGKCGHAYITATATTPALSWTTESEDVRPIWSVTIGDVQQLRKVGGLGWQSKIMVGWATEREVADGLFIRDKTGVEHHLTAIATRDELFNRLVAMGTQIWEVM